MALAVYVTASSVLGLALVPGIWASHDTLLAGVMNVWQNSLVADAVFGAGSICVGWFSWHLAIKLPVLAVPAGYFLSFFVYLFALISPLIDHSGSGDVLGPQGMLLILVFWYGQLGLIFTAVAPLLLALVTLIWDRRTDPARHR